LVSITSIAVNPYQPRRAFAPEALDELAESIRRHGILQPLIVRQREGGYELIAGERRLQAARKAGLADVPVVVRETTDEQMLALSRCTKRTITDIPPTQSPIRMHAWNTTESGLPRQYPGAVGRV
jgi:ParB family chromosome partitioning protein